VDGNGFVWKRDVSGQLDDVVKQFDNLLLLGVEEEATELDNVRPSCDEFFDGRCGSASWCPGRKSGGFGVKYENEHCWQAGKISLERKYKKDFNFLFRDTLFDAL
jgi:hypothetical protein